MSFNDHMAALDGAVMTHLGDGLCDYQGAAVTANGIEHILDESFEVYDENQIPMRVRTISVLVADVPESRSQDVIELPDRSWTVQQVLEDDGHIRRLWVS